MYLDVKVNNGEVEIKINLLKLANDEYVYNLIKSSSIDANEFFKYCDMKESLDMDHISELPRFLRPRVDNELNKLKEQIKSIDKFGNDCLNNMSLYKYGELRNTLIKVLSMNDLYGYLNLDKINPNKLKELRESEEYKNCLLFVITDNNSYVSFKGLTVLADNNLFPRELVGYCLYKLY